MITLAIDTSEARGSVALRRGGAVAAIRRHSDQSDYSEWLLPAVDQLLAEAGIKMEQVGLLGVSTGPGSFTGLRVGLTTVKAWAEVYGKPVVGVSRLEAIARSRRSVAGFVTASYDAHRGQLFGAVYQTLFGRTRRIGDEVVASAEEFVQLVDRIASGAVTWISLDPELIRAVQAIERRIQAGDQVVLGPAELAPAIGLLAESRAVRGEFDDALGLDANYVRRSDAEIFWKGSSCVR